MVLPDGAPTRSERPPPGGRTILAVAALALTLGALALGALTSPDPVAIAETTTTTSTTSTIADLEPPIDFDNFTVEQIATGEPLDWERVTELEGGWSSTMVSQLGWLYLVTSASPPPIGGTWPSPRVYRTLDGTSWEDLGTVGPTNGYLAAVSSTPFGLMAIEDDYAAGSLIAWTSRDGVEWEPTPIDATQDGMTSRGLNALGSNGSMTVVAGNVFQDATLLIEQKLHDIGIDVDTRTMGGWDLISSGEGATVVVYGPLGIPALSVPEADLDLTELDRMIIQGNSGDVTAAAWATTDGLTWSPSTIGDADWISTVAPAPDGALLAFGFYGAGNTAWRTYDGVSWEKLGPASRVRSAVPWKGRLVGVNDYGTPEAYVSATGETWEELGLADYFPARISWYPVRIAASEAVIAIAVQGFPSTGLSGPVGTYTPITLEHDGMTLTLVLDQSRAELDDGETKRFYRLYDVTVQNLAVDLAGQTVAFLDEAGEELARFGFDELQRAESEYYSSSIPYDTTVTALAYTRDGGRWAIQDLDQAFGDGSQIVALAATPFQLVAAVAPGRDFGPGTGPDHVQIWVAPLPSR